MALIWKAQEVVAPPISGFSWDNWYAKNKSRLSEKRAKRYREDAAYREAALERSRKQRESKKSPMTGPYTVSFNDAAQGLGVTVWVLREWRRKNYFPEPIRRDGRLWFSHKQVQLLRHVQQFFLQYGSRLAESNRGELDDITGLVYANWA
jgi:hypothetical protein